MIVGRILCIFSSGNYSFFLAAALFGNITSLSIFQSPMVIAMEISTENDNAKIAMLQNIGYTIGNCIMPLAMWACGHWVHFIVLTTIPCVLFLFPFRLVCYHYFFRQIKFRFGSTEEIT